MISNCLCNVGIESRSLREGRDGYHACRARRHHSAEEMTASEVQVDQGLRIGLFHRILLHALSMARKIGVFMARRPMLGHEPRSNLRKHIRDM
jgi:hypothetical protein